ncbi:extracellular matrix-binding ebh [Babesia caballi]|uniref:Extracellular matrix-binding ebh n=1 Tax=Babesia caballi TaxID=5871 RepID=A0AAV4LZI8_BABCB|nr:extracellular matrix-binding ebh [Babesia caballi]
MTAGQKSLTDPPTNLKEAIDWVIQIKELSAIDDLAKELQELLKHDGSDVAMKVLENYRLVSKSVIKGLKSHTNGKNRLTSPISEWGFAAPYAILNKLSQGLGPFPSGSAAISREEAEKWVSKVRETTLGALIGGLANGLKKFKSGIITSPSVASAYNSEAKWESLQASERRDCAIIFLAIIPLFYIALTYLYWRCSQSPDSEDPFLSWYEQNLSETKGLKKYVEALGYTENLNTSKNGREIVSDIFDKMFSKELAKGNVSSKSYPNFLSELQKPLESKPPQLTSSPLTSSVIRPRRPLFLTAPNLKEAIDWIPRVTGKDGGGGPDGNEQKLAQAIVGLHDFKQVIDAAARKLSESGSDDVSQAIKNLNSTSNLGSIIGKLADGLKAFIGYGGQGKGIANVVDPLQQLRKGVLMLLQMMLDTLRGYIKNHGDFTSAYDKAIRGGQHEFEEAVKKVEGLQENNSGTGSGSQFKNFVDALKDVSELKSKNTVDQLAKGFKTYLGAVLGAVKRANGINGKQGEVDNMKSTLGNLLNAVGNQTDFSNLKTQVNNDTRQLKSTGLRYPASFLVEGVTKGIDNMLIPLQKKEGYKSSYQLASTWTSHLKTNASKAAQIFLGCLPLYYYWLTYLYWKCREKGEWEKMAFNGSGGGFALKNFLVGQGYNASHLTATRGFKGSSIATSLQSLGMSSVTTTQLSHTDLLGEIDKGLKGVIGTGGLSTANLDGHSLSALFHLCRCYFTGKQIINPVTERRPPTSIREMLYWLSGLQFSPYYYDLTKQIETHIPRAGLHVADSAINTSNNMITQSQMKGFLLSSCLSAPGVLGTIQGNAADTNGEPWLHSLFSNTMNLQYPSGSAIFNTLANYAYALQFQLGFLYQQCRTNYNQSYGWQWCRYGKSAQTDGNNSVTLTSWICSAPNCSRGYSCPHNSNTCDHIKQCGQSGQPSPLQAFLTDNLKSFHVNQKPDPLGLNHLDNHPPGSMCHVTMGFDGTLTKDTDATGWYIYYLLEHFCGFTYGPLRQLSEKLSCLTKRTPRTLGDIFGFLWHLNGQMFKARPTRDILARKLVNAIGETNQYKTIPQFLFDILKKAALPSSFSGTSATGLSRSLESMAPVIPFLYQLFMAKDVDSLPVVLFDLYQQCHKVEVQKGGKVSVEHSVDGVSHHNHNCSSSPAYLFSLQTSRCTKGPNCGPYLYPLTHTTGSAFAPTYASSYFSWVLYLIDDFEVGLREMLDEFTNIDCTKSGCHEQKCREDHSSGQHGATSSSQCTCSSVVHCGGVLPLLYSNGFNFASAGLLKNGGSQSSGKKTCQNFHDQLTTVLAPNESTPLFKLLLTIDDFLYMFRFYFFYNLSTFWIMYVCIILYIYFLRADLLHLKSHVHFPSSHGIPSIGLLTTGRSTVLTKLSKLTYFIP